MTTTPTHRPTPDTTPRDQTRTRAARQRSQDLRARRALIARTGAR